MSTITTPSSSGQKALTQADCDALRHVISDIQVGVALGGIDYLKDQAATDNFADHVQVPSNVTDSVKTFRSFVDQFASTAKDVGIAPNKTPLPDQMDRFNAKFHPNVDAAKRAFQTLDTWTGNSCS